jgi:chaperone modulatory protein CbpM
MEEKDKETSAVEVIDEQTEFTLAELCHTCNVQAEFVEALVEEGILEPVGKRGSHWCFHASSLRRTRVTLHLQHDLGVNLAGAALALELLERIEKLEVRLRTAGAGRVRERGERTE